MVMLCVYIPVVIINFSQSTYSVNENDDLVQTVLILSNPSVFDVTLQNRDISVDSPGIKHLYITIYYIHSYVYLLIMNVILL